MDLTFNQNEDHLRSLVSQIEQRAAIVRLGGGKKAIEKQKAKNKKLQGSELNTSSTKTLLLLN